MKNKSLLNVFTVLTCGILGFTSVTAENPRIDLANEFFPGQAVPAEMQEALSNLSSMAAPQANRAQEAQKNRVAQKVSDGMNGFYRPQEVITKNEMGETLMKYIYLYDEAGTFYSTEQSMVRDRKRWNKVEQVWDNDSRFKLIFDENGDMVEAFTDTGYKDSWDNHFRIQYTYDDKHNQLTVSQQRWQDEEWYAFLRWTNEYDESGNILFQTYENRPTDGEWSYGSQHSWTYDEVGRELSHQIAHYSVASGKYSPYLLEEWTYDANGNQLTHQQSQSGNPVFLQTMEYNENNLRTTLLEQRWNNGAWSNSAYTTFEYDDQNREKAVITQMWTGDQETGSWANRVKTSSMYLPTATMQLHSKWDAETETWKDSERIVQNFNESGLITRWAHDYWMEDVKHMQTGDQVRYIYNSDNNLTDMIDETWAPAKLEFIPTSVFQYEYDENLNGNKVLCSRKQAKEWISLHYNHMADEWGAPEYESFIADATYLDLRNYVKTTGVMLNHTTYDLEKDLSFRLTPTVFPADASNNEVYWASSNEEVARVSVDGRVYGIAPGTTDITARTLNGGFVATCKVTVKEESGIDNTNLAIAFSYNDDMLHFSDAITAVEVIDVFGRIIYTQDSNKSVNTSVWSNGTYFVRMHTAVGQQTHKVQVY